MCVQYCNLLSIEAIKQNNTLYVMFFFIVPQCPTLMAPDNGMIDCSLGDDGVPTNGDTCTVTCNDGFMLVGDATRTCQISRRRMDWSGTEASCVPGMRERCKYQVS